MIESGRTQFSAHSFAAFRPFDKVI